MGMALFQLGGPGGPGRPKRETERAVLDAITNALSPEDIADAIREGLRLAIMQKSTRGIVALLSLVADHSVGRPVARTVYADTSVIEEAMQSWIQMKQQAIAAELASPKEE